MSYFEVYRVLTGVGIEVPKFCGVGAGAGVLKSEAGAESGLKKWLHSSLVGLGISATTGFLAKITKFIISMLKLWRNDQLKQISGAFI